MSIRQLLGKRVIICDGAMGTMIQKSGIPVETHPEMLNFTHPEEIKNIYKQYYEAGSDFVSTNTFGANAFKMEGCGYSVTEIVTQAVKIAKEAAAEMTDKLGRPCYVGLDIAPIGRLMEPAGDMTFEEAVDLFKEQAEAGVRAGADLVVCETFTDIYEMKAAIVAVRETTDLPLFCSVTFQEDGRMLMGTDPETMVYYLQDMGMDALGVNCSLGPKQMIPIAEQVLEICKLPVLIQPNAGLPRIENGETVFDVTIEEYAQVMEGLVEKGLAVAGACCGTSPDYIRALAARVGERPVKAAAGFARAAAGRAPMTVCSATKTVRFDGGVKIIGERINPTGKKALKEALKSGDFSYIEDEAVRQVQAGAHILDVNVGLPEIDEREAMLEAVRRVSQAVNAPIQIDSANPEVLEAAVRQINGKPIINSVNGKEESLNAVLPIAKKYGADIVALTLDEKGLPENEEQRVAIAERIITRAAEYGIGPERILVDCLTLTVSAQQTAAADTLSAIRTVKERFGVHTTLGASNISFGLPNRRLLNSAFLVMAMMAGLDAPITDPLVGEYTDAIFAFSALSGKDRECASYIETYAPTEGERRARQAAGSQGRGTAGGGAAVSSASGAGVTASPQSSAGGCPCCHPAERKTTDGAANMDGAAVTLYEIILKGYIDRAPKAAQELLKTKEPLEIVEEVVIPALEVVGKDYESGKSFLPQLIKSADTVRAAFGILKEVMSRGGVSMSYGKIILATVEGDIHDIGKNIVKVLLENYGYEVIDLGKDVPAEEVVRTARDENIRLVGLSALMTTTVVSMEKTIQALKEAGLPCRVAVGGAVLNQEYADKIGADYYCREAMDTVKAANELFKK